MSYIINRWDGTEIAVIQDGTVNQSLDIKLIGKNYAGYGEIQNENFLHMLENFAGEIEPPNAIRGQVWFDTTVQKLKVFSGDVVNGAKVWKNAAGADYTNTAPSNPTNGDFWFDTTKDQLKVRNGSTWLSIGPQSAGTGITQMVSREVLGTDGITHAIIAATVNDSVVYTISEDADFYLDSENDPESAITGFTLIKRGLTLQNTDPVTGISGVDTTHYYWGTAGNSLRLGGLTADQYITSLNPVFNERVNFKDPGFTVGNGNDLAVFIEADINPIIEAKTGPAIYFRVKSGTDVLNPVIINNTGIIPGNVGTATPYNLGSATKVWNNVYANRFVGTADKSNQLLVGVDFRDASTLSSANTIAVRDGNKYLYADRFIGVAEKADQLAVTRTINGVGFDGTGNIVVTDDTKLPLAGGAVTGPITLPADPTSNLHASTKQYVDNKFGVGGILGIANGGTNAASADSARTNLNVPSRSGAGATGTWDIGISGNALTATTASTLAGGAIGAIPFQVNPGQTSFLNIGTAGQLLTVAGSVPVWKDVDLVAVGLASKISVTDKPTEAGTYYVPFVSATSGGQTVFTDSTLFTYNTNTNTLTTARFSGALVGNADTATKLAVARTISLAGAITGSASFDGSGNVSLNTTYSSNIVLGTNTSGSYVASISGTGYVSVASGSGAGSTPTVSINATSANTAGAVVARDGSGNFSAGTITAGLFQGTATSARYADLAEKYLADAEYEVGTVVVVGGEKEITLSSAGQRAIGVVSANPAYMMNSELEGGTYVALKGRVPVKVTGAVQKGDRLVADNHGAARAVTSHMDVFAIALESSDDQGVKLIEAIIL